ncbi:hypothetical protein HBI88_243360 [Parastagonospora nodorum]|nr:hypothetical protein HBI97_243120 [Parastagonospora nodorum]KAH5783171.1 hypothetical protein HBI96_243520 [Parastagonospora nodorum]KAH5796443.1 hypothetical protein HBI94_243150 [Parastagonospora nodorum]KAH5807008.1 hypothetical protein HBI93_243690 [Parastagonospora nodorum]KAH5844256.1 hypothetical protein HBI91_246130 [Parastagonospora nodorum]
MYDEVSKFRWRNVALAITDLSVLEKLGSMEKDGLPGVLTHGTSELNLTLRMPFVFFQAIERPEEDTEQVRIWTGIPSTLANVLQWEGLSIWFDHADAQIWSVVDERALLTPLLAYLSNTVIKSTLFLPMLHPVYELPERHLLNPTIGNARVTRKLRQRWRGVVNCRGETDVVYRPDYPYSVDAFDGYMTPGEAEVWERGAWKDGIDVEAVAKEIRGFGNVQYAI